MPQPSPSDDMYEKVVMSWLKVGRPKSQLSVRPNHSRRPPYYVQMEDVARMAEKNEDDALSKYLEAWVRNVSLEEGHDLKVARLKKELAATSDWLQQATVNYLHLRGRFNMRGILGEVAGQGHDSASPAAFRILRMRCIRAAKPS